MSGGIEKALSLIKKLPRVNLTNLRPLIDVPLGRKRLGRNKGGRCGRAQKGQKERNTLPPIGKEGGNTPFYLLIPKEPYYDGFKNRKEYPPLSLLSLQRLIDLARLDPTKPIDLSTLCNTKAFKIDTQQRHYGVNLIDEGADLFNAKVNIEVQWTNEAAIAAIERNGGVIKTRFLDILSVDAMADPKRYFQRGLVIPRCKLPPQDLIEYYSDAKNRGYLADPEKIAEARLELAQKYGYKLPDLTKDPLYEMLKLCKDPRQIWYGLEPGWVINMVDKCILKPSDKNLIHYYKS